jgi:hypothetical protein
MKAIDDAMAPSLLGTRIKDIPVYLRI